MKPGLRKIAALILASTTLFGGDALSASTAYADDTTLDTSTQLQAEPDTQTTMGGDVSETTPDNSSDNDAGTQPEFNNSYIPPVTPAIVKTIRQLAKTGVSTPTVALAAFTLLVVGLTVAYSVRRRHAVTPRHRR